MHLLIALLHPAQVPHVHADEPSGALWFALAIGLSGSIALLMANRRASQKAHQPHR